MKSSQRAQVDCKNVSSASFNETQIAVQLDSEMKLCLFWSIVHDEALLNISKVLIILFVSFSLLVNCPLLLGLKHSEDFSWNPRYMLWKNLIVSDLLLTLSIGSPALYLLFSYKTLTFSFPCVAQYFVVALALLNSLLTVTSMAFERFVYICHGIHYPRLTTNMRVYCFFICLWVLAITGAGISTALVLMYRGTYGHIIAGFVCEPEVVHAQLEYPKYFERFNQIFVGSVLVLCLLVFMFSYGRMYQEARKVQQPFQQDNARARCTISFYFAIFLLQLFPVTIKFITLCGQDVDNQLYMIMLVLVPPAVNPVAYSIRNMEVRQALERLCRWVRLKDIFCHVFLHDN